jgi:NDP-sugar pyrophosphorylase family protein
MGHHLELFRSLGIRRCFLVVGHLMDHIINHFGRGQELGMEIHYVEQEKVLGIAHAVGQVDGVVDGPFVLCLGDIFYLSRSMDRLVERYRRGDVAAVLAVKEEQDPAPVRRNFTVETDAAGYVSRVEEKPRQPRNLVKGCGIYLFGPEILDAIRKTPRTALRDEYEITTSIQILVDDGARVAIEPVIDWDLNVTFPEDLLAGNLKYLEHLGVDNLVHDTAEIHPGATLSRCVIGPHARIPAPILLRDCVVMERSVVPEEEDLHRALIARDMVIRR